MDHKRKTLNQFQIEDNREDSLNRSVDGLSSCCLTSAEVFPEMEQKNFFQCDMCDKILSRKDTLEVHKKTHTGIRFKCNECDSEYSREDKLKMHQKKKHGFSNKKILESKSKSLSVESPSSTREIETLSKQSSSPIIKKKRMECKLCQWRFPDKVKLSQHMETHGPRYSSRIGDNSKVMGEKVKLEINDDSLDSTDDIKTEADFRDLELKDIDIDNSQLYTDDIVSDTEETDKDEVKPEPEDIKPELDTDEMNTNTSDVDLKHDDMVPDKMDDTLFTLKDFRAQINKDDPNLALNDAVLEEYYEEHDEKPDWVEDHTVPEGRKRRILPGPEAMDNKKSRHMGNCHANYPLLDGEGKTTGFYKVQIPILNVRKIENSEKGEYSQIWIEEEMQRIKQKSLWENSLCKLKPSSKFCENSYKARSDLYGHYSSHHFKAEILNTFGETLTCPVCEMVTKRSSELIVHVGRVHNFVENFLPKEYHVSMKNSFLSRPLSGNKRKPVSYVSEDPDFVPSNASVDSAEDDSDGEEPITLTELKKLK